MNTEETDSIHWEILKNFFDKYGVVSHQLDSFNNLVNITLRKIFEEEPDIFFSSKKDQLYKVSIGQYYIDNPSILDDDRNIRKIFPKEARLRDLTYESNIFLDIYTELSEINELGENKIIEKNVYKRFPIMKIPIMVGSCKCNLFNMTMSEKISNGECEYDKGGYFIIKGKERVIVGQKRGIYNTINVLKQKSISKYRFAAEIRSMSEETAHSVSIQAKINNSKQIYFSLPYINSDIEAGIVFKALGYNENEFDSIINVPEKFSENNIIKDIINQIKRDSFFIKNKQEAVDHISEFILTHSEKKSNYVTQVLENEIFPHMGISSTALERITILGIMVKKLILTFTKLRPCDDRDNLSNKRIDLAGPLIGDLIKSLFKRFIKYSQKIKSGSRPDFISNIHKFKMTPKLLYCFSTGNWGVQKSSYIRKGVSQVLSRLSYNSTLSHLRRISMSIGAEGKNSDIRQLHNSSIFFICCHETPEGIQCGIVQNLALTTKVSVKISTVIIREIIEKSKYIININNLTIEECGKNTKIFLNGILIGITLNPIEYVEEIKEKKKIFAKNPFSIVYDNIDEEIIISCEEGRLIRPIFTLDDSGILKIKNTNIRDWDKLVENGYIEYIDSLEAEYNIINMDLKDNNEGALYQEIHPSMMLGVCAGTIPHSSHSQSPRLCYSASMMKQAVGIFALNNKARSDKASHLLYYPQRNISNTKTAEFIGSKEMPAGMNCIVAILSYSGLNQEDSLIINKSAVERGLFRSFVIKNVLIEENEKIEICMPSDNIQNKVFNYDKLDEDGIVSPGTLIEINDVLVGRISNKKDKKEDERKDCSVIAKKENCGIVDDVIVTSNKDGYKMVKIKIRNIKIPEVGDKCASTCGQKGVIGSLTNAEDMPATLEGIIPDIIINSHAIPSRMTINQIIECITGKTSLLKGKYMDSTTFGDKSSYEEIINISSKLTEYGYQNKGYERMICGITGKMLEANVFVGPTYYQCLKHFVADKIHARSSVGPVQLMNFQPRHGRMRDGGLRFGEMERDALHGKAKITLNCGLSVFIENMSNCDNVVLGWDKLSEMLIPSKQTAFLFKGQRECLRVTLEDGRTENFSLKHPILTSDNEWIRINKLVPGKHKIKVGVSYPVVDFKKEISECNGWELKVGNMLFKTCDTDSYMKTLTMVRIIGYLLTDGHVCENKCQIFLGNMIDVNNFLLDLKVITDTKQKKFLDSQSYTVRIPKILSENIIEIKGLTIGKKVNQKASLPDFILDKKCPKPIVREFLAAIFGGDGHTCVLSKHRGKRDLLSSISFSKSITKPYLDSLKDMFENIKNLLARFDITKITIQNFKETSISKSKYEGDEKCYELTLHLDINELIPFHDNIGFRYCCHKTQRLEAAVSYKRLRNEVVRQHNWIVARVDEITNFSELKKKNPNKIVPTKKAIEQAVNELKIIEPLIHQYAVPSTHDITDHLVKGTEFGKFTSKSFPNAEEYMKKIGALSWFIDELDENDIIKTTKYAVDRKDIGLPTMTLEIIDIRSIGEHDVYDIEVENTNSFLANGIVSHNCIISQGLSAFLKERLFDMSDPYKIRVCKDCGFYADRPDECSNCEGENVTFINAPYAAILLINDLKAMGIKICLSMEK